MKTKTLSNYTLYVDLLILILIATAVRIIGVGIDHLPVGDEMFHVLSAQSWASDGTLSIADGTYDRAAIFTKSIGVMFTVFGESLVIARLPALIFGVFWALLLYLWVSNHAGRLAAWIAVLLFCMAPHGIELSLYSRMYTLHGFSFLLGTILVFALITQENPLVKKLFLITGVIVCFSLAGHLHNITLIGLIALMFASAVDFSVQHRKFLTNKKSMIWIMISLLFIVVAICIFLYLYWDLFSPYWQKYITPAFADRDSDIRYYHKLLTKSYPLLWLLLPFTAAIAIYSKPRIGLFCVSIFIVILVMHSIAGRKAERYIYYGLPFLFTIWGIAIAAIIPYLDKLLSDMSHSFRTNYLPIAKASSFDFVFKSLFAFIAIVFMLSSSDSFMRTVNLLRGESYYFGTQLSNWEKAVPKLKPLIDSAPVVVTTNFPKTQYYFGSFDIAFSPVIVTDVLHGNEGGIDSRTGRPAIGTTESLQQIFDKYPHGLFVGEKSEWRNRFRMTDKAADLMEKHARQVELPSEARIVAYIW
jgi:hypothetical protein